MVLAILLTALLLGAIIFYLYQFVRRSLRSFGLDVCRPWPKGILIVLTVLLGSITLYVFGFGAIIILHLVLLALLVQLFDFGVKCFAGKKYQTGFVSWKKVYGSGIIPVVLTIAVMVAGYFQLHTIVQTDYTVYTDKNIRDEGYRVALIADVHYGVSIDREELMNTCRDISNQQPDVVVLCGDIVDNATTKEEMQTVFGTLGTIESRYGIYYVYGNHDRPMRLMSGDFTAGELADAIEQNGITILQDQAITIHNDLVLVGREDKSQEQANGGRASIEELLADVNPQAFVLTLDHQPNDYAANGTAGTDLLLSGHTHGGQLFPLDILQRIIPFNDGVYGLYAVDDNTSAIVTSGLAAWNYPIRTAGVSEYVMIDIVEY